MVCLNCFVYDMRMIYMFGLIMFVLEVVYNVLIVVVVFKELGNVKLLRRKRVE